MVAAAADFATGIWGVTVIVTTARAGSAGKMGFTDKYGLAGIGYAITLTLNLLFTGVLALFFYSTFLGTRVFCQAKSCCCTAAVGVGYQTYPLVLNMFSFFLLAMDRDGVLCSRGCRI